MNPTDEITTKIRPEWALVAQNLVLVDLTIKRWRGMKRARFADFGLHERDWETYRAGTRSLLPKDVQDELNLLEGMARDLVARYAYKTLFGLLVTKQIYHWIKNGLYEKTLAEVRRELYGSAPLPKGREDIWRTTSLMARWNWLAEEIATNREIIVGRMQEAWRQSVIVSWRIRSGLAQDAESQPDINWLETQLDRMAEGIPSANQIRSSFVLDLRPALIETPEEALKAVRMEEIERKAQEVENKLARLSGSDAAAKRELLEEYEQLRIDRDLMRDIAEAERQARQEKIDNVLDTVSTQLYEYVLDAVVRGLEAVDRSNTLHPKFIGNVKRTVEVVRALNFTENEQIERACAMLSQLEADLPRKEGYGQVTDKASRAVGVMRQIGANLSAEVITAGLVSRTGADLEEAKETGLGDLVRRARDLGLTPDKIGGTMILRQPRRLGEGAMQEGNVSSGITRSPRLVGPRDLAEALLSRGAR